VTQHIGTFGRLLLWIEKNQRHLSSLVFIAAFILDIIAFSFLELSYINIIFVVYLLVAALGTIVTLVVHSRFQESPYRATKILTVLAPLATQFAIGSLLSGCLIFYTKSSTLSVSWPFIFLIALVFLGNEYFRSYRAHLIFQTTLFFFALYSYIIFALPLYVGALGPEIFLASTLLSVLIFLIFLRLLWRISKQRVQETKKGILGGFSATVVVVVTAYFTGLVPPIPLTLQDGAIYHSVERRGGDYVVTGEIRTPWWDVSPQVIQHVAGSPLHAYSAVFAPGAFQTSVVHHWEYYNEGKGVWETRARVPYTLSGGRSGGYRGYSTITGVISEGRWRVSVETAKRQVIGRISFVVTSVKTAGPRIQETL